MNSYSPPSDDTRQTALAKLERDYDAIRAELPFDWDQKSSFVRALMTLERTSSPGYPYLLESPTISDWLFRGNLIPDPVRMDMLWSDVRRVLNGEYEHIFRVFMKLEPHTVQKVKQGRWRLIIQSSLAMQVAWKMAVNHLETSLLKKMGVHPSAFGEVWFAGGWRRFRSRAKNLGMNWCLDKSAWDWNSPGWVYEDILELRKRLTVGGTQKWEDTMDMLYRDAFIDSRVLVGGDLYQQIEPGLMKSGLVTTLSDNSFAQGVLDRNACVHLGIPWSVYMATGDDTIQRKPINSDEYVRVIQRFGCVVKEQLEGIEFMGNRFVEYGPEPLYVGKHLVNISQILDENLPTTVDSYMRNYANSKLAPFWRELAYRLKVPVRSRQFYEWFMNNPSALDRGVSSGLLFGNHTDTSRYEASVVV